MKDFVSGNISDGDWIEKNHIFPKGKYRIIQTGNLGSNGEYSEKSDHAKFMNQNDFDELQANEIFPGDILISRLASPAGRTIILPDIGFRMVTAVDVTIIRPNEFFDRYFFKTIMNSTKVLRNVNRQVTGTTHLRISRKHLEGIKLCISNSLEEQQRIGRLFKKIDEIIALYQRQTDLLNKLKLASLKNLFVDANSKAPRIRFVNFVDNWEQHQLSEVVDVHSGKDYKHLKAGNIPVFGTGGYMLSVNNKLSDQDSIGLGRKGTINKPYILRAPFWTVDTLFFLTPHDKYSLYFVFSLIQKINWLRLNEATGVPSLSRKIINSVVVFSPDISEQDKISNLVQIIDYIQFLYQNKIDDQQRLKSFLLQKLFA